MIKKYKIKMLTIVLISLMSFNSFVYKYNYKYDYVKSESILDLEELKRQNDVKINELEKSLTSAKNYLTSSEEDENLNENYQDNLNELYNLEEIEQRELIYYTLMIKYLFQHPEYKEEKGYERTL